jgi:hypothetical protein
MRLGAKVALAVAIPSLVAFVLISYGVVTKWTERAEMARLGQFVSGVAGISNLVHHMQRERGASAVFVGSKGAQLAAELPQQRKLTDEQRRTFTALMGQLRELSAESEYRSAITAGEQAVAALDEKRRQIDTFAITAFASNDYFTASIARLLTVAAEISKASTRADLTTAISSYVAFMQGKERSGQERATGAAGISSGKFDMNGYIRVLGLVAAQNGNSSRKPNPIRSSARSRRCARRSQPAASREKWADSTARSGFTRPRHASIP